MKITVGTDPNDVHLFDDAGNELKLPILRFSIQHHGLDASAPLTATIEVEIFGGVDVEVPDRFVTVEKVIEPEGPLVQVTPEARALGFEFQFSNSATGPWADGIVAGPGIYMMFRRDGEKWSPPMLITAPDA